ncbi:hypothetical protein CYLTODRAFT_212618 [Cylindrobasidium torrendii FP15055 ss-10]|uniref:AB hydrolase-1 domain-containing protein n=1 Tax=Cylindrobasidium torrendii FP15055 ss-10 TaxID=1314674 RepID=A0A0D7BGT3_9AGAR|nr:hypothetical protein CYLTODRAFT_212618 [Cylindrobasidium torrendii FP15055 ss-10]
MAPAQTSSTHVSFPATPALITARRVRGGKETVKCSLKQVVERRVPSLFEAFEPVWWLRNGTFQTLYDSLVEQIEEENDQGVRFQRSRLRTLDGRIIPLCSAPFQPQDVDNDAPIIVIVNGSNNGSSHPFVQSIASRASEVGGLGYRTVVVSLPQSAPTEWLRKSCQDLRLVLLHLVSRHPGSPLLGLGLSVGSNVLIRYLVEEGTMSRLHTACLLSCPWDLQATPHSMGTMLKAPSTYLRSMLNDLVSAVWESTEIQPKDEPYASLLPEISIPTLTLNAWDDPAVPRSRIPLGVNPNVVMVSSRNGGHLGWHRSPESDERWTTPVVLEWLRMSVEDVAAPRRPSRTVFVAEDGFVREAGRESVGCRVDSGILVSALSTPNA